MKELKGLTTTAGVVIKDQILHRGDNINPAYYIGKGKLKAINERINSQKLNLVIFDNELSPAQFRNLEED
jgi:GTP-binding protein HflX